MDTTNVQDKKPAKEAYFEGKQRESYMEDLRNQSIAAFLVSHIDVFEKWLEDHIQDSELKCACVGFITMADAQAHKAQAISELSRQMAGLRSESNNAATHSYYGKVGDYSVQAKLDRLWAMGKPNPATITESAMEPAPDH